MARHYDFQRIGVIDDAVALATDIFKGLTTLFGGDQVPNYPVKKASTLASLAASVKEWVGGVMPPTSVEMAKEMLARAVARQAYEDSIGHGYGDGVGWDTLQMLYDEVITALKQYIASAGQAYNPTAGTGLPTSPQPTPTLTTPVYGSSFFTDKGLFGLPNWVTMGGAAFALYYFTKKKRR
jgi:hypothetical protein